MTSPAPAEPEEHQEPPPAASAAPVPSASPSGQASEVSDPEIIDAELAFPWERGPSFQPAPLVRTPAEPTFHVPKRFGMSAILGITTALAILFGLLRAFGAHEVFYLYFGLLSMVICLAQMRFGDVPRQASIIAGAVMLPVFLIGFAIFGTERFHPEMMCLIFGSLPIGAFLGYVTGTFAGGVFLVMDLFEKYWTRRSALATSITPPA